MAVTLICPSCGFENKTPGVFCGRCGGRMGVDAAPEFENKKDPVRAFRLTMSFIKTAINLALLVVIVLLLWPMPSTPIEANEDAALKFNKLVEQFIEAGQKQGTAVHVFNEADINNYIAWHVQQDQSAVAGTGYRMKIRSAQFSLQPGRVTINILASLGPLKISHTLEGQPAARTGQRLSFTIERARIGHMPMPRMLQDWVATKISDTFSAMERDRLALNHVFRLALNHVLQMDPIDGKVRVVIGR